MQNVGFLMMRLKLSRVYHSDQYCVCFQMELPLYFAALSNGDIDIDLLRNIIPVSPVSVDQLFYKVNVLKDVRC